MLELRVGPGSDDAEVCGPHTSYFLPQESLVTATSVPDIETGSLAYCNELLKLLEKPIGRHLLLTARAFVRSVLVVSGNIRSELLVRHRCYIPHKN